MIKAKHFGGDSMLNQVKTALEKRGFSVKLCATAQEAKEYLLSAIDPAQSVGFGGSMTLKQMGMDEALISRGNTVHWHWTAEDKEGAHRQAAVADVYLTSANALTENGLMVNIDGHGNRVAATLHGPGRVIFVVGKNKLTPNYESAIRRIKNTVCPANARRMSLKTPCAELGYCTDCSGPQRICGATVILEHSLIGYPMEVVLVDEDLGY